jgi:hypothetical protein
VKRFPSDASRLIGGFSVRQATIRNPRAACRRRQAITVLAIEEAIYPAVSSAEGSGVTWRLGPLMLFHSACLATLGRRVPIEGSGASQLSRQDATLQSVQRETRR